MTSEQVEKGIEQILGRHFKVAHIGNHRFESDWIATTSFNGGTNGQALYYWYDSETDRIMDLAMASALAGSLSESAVK